MRKVWECGQSCAGESDVLERLGLCAECVSELSSQQSTTSNDMVQRRGASLGRHLERVEPVEDHHGLEQVRLVICVGAVLARRLDAGVVGAEMIKALAAQKGLCLVDKLLQHDVILTRGKQSLLLLKLRVGRDEEAGEAACGVRLEIGRGGDAQGVLDLVEPLARLFEDKRVPDAVAEDEDGAGIGIVGVCDAGGEVVNVLLFERPLGEPVD